MMSLKRVVPQHWLKPEARMGDIYHVNGLCSGTVMALDILAGAEDIRAFLGSTPPEALAVVGDLQTAHLEREEEALEFLYLYAKWKEMGAMLSGFQMAWMIRRNWPSDPIEIHQDEIGSVWTREMIIHK